jgi:hypothetical protein
MMIKTDDKQGRLAIYLLMVELQSEVKEMEASCCSAPGRIH